MKYQTKLLQLNLLLHIIGHTFIYIPVLTLVTENLTHPLIVKPVEPSVDAVVPLKLNHNSFLLSILTST